MPTAYIYRGTFEVRAGETLRYVEVAADGTISPEVTKTYAELAGSGSITAAAVSLTPTVAAPTLTGVQIGAIEGVSVSLQPTVSPAAVSGVQVGAIAAVSVSLRPIVATHSVAGVMVGSIAAAAVSLQPTVATGELIGVAVQTGSISAAAVTCQPAVAVGTLTGVTAAASATISPTLDGVVETRTTGGAVPVWADVKTATTGTFASGSETAASVLTCNYTDPEYGDYVASVSRVFFSFAIPSDAISSAVLKLVVPGKTTGTFTLCVQKSSQGDTLELADARAFNDADPVFTTVSISATGSYDFTFNAAGLTYLNSVRGGTAYLVVRNYTYDYQSNTPPEGSGDVFCTFGMQENATEANRPRLVLNG